MQRNLFLTVALLCIVAQGTFADTFRDKEGYLYYIFNASEDLNNNTAEVTWQYEDHPNNYSGYTTVNIPSIVVHNHVNYRVIGIREKAFSFCKTLTSVSIPNTITSIGSDAFYECGLTSIDIPNSVTHIGHQAFHGCSGLTSLVIPNSVTSIANSAFDNCRNLTTVSIDCSTHIPYAAFSECRTLTTVTIGDNVSGIGEEAFERCYNLQSVSFGNSVTSLGRRAFSNCYNLGTVNIPRSVTYIAQDAFSSCTGLSSIEVEAGNTVYDSRDNCNAIIKTNENVLVYACKNTFIPNTITSIGYRAFSDCRDMTSIHIPSSVQSIGQEAFANCTVLSSIEVEAGNTVYDSRNNCNAIIRTADNTLIQGCKNSTIPNDVVSIASGAFSECTGLTSIDIANSVTSIGDGAFWYCTGLKSIICKAATPPTLGEFVFLLVNKSIPLYVPAGSIAAYQAADQWKSFTNIVPIPDWDDPNIGTATNPIVITDLNIWNLFAEQVSNGNSFSGKYVRLDTDLSVNTMVGKNNDTPFSGIFLGNGHTITTTLSDSENDGVALFRCINGATIKNLKVEGLVQGQRYNAALVGYSKGNGNRIESCVVSADVKGSGNIGGIVGQAVEGGITIAGCVFSGKLISDPSDGNIAQKGAFIGWYKGAGSTIVTDCLFLMQNAQETKNLDLVKGTGPITLNKCYKSKAGSNHAPKKIAAEDIPQAEWEDEEDYVYEGIWANVYDVMPNYFGELLEDYGFLKVYEGGLEYEQQYYVACINIADKEDNSELIRLATDYIVDVSLTDRTFYKNNAWQTLCLPFSLDDFAGTPLDGAHVKTLSGSSYDESTNTLTLDFSEDLTAIEAGKPYIVKWINGEDIIYPMFTGVIVDSVTADVHTTYADFIGTCSPVIFTNEDLRICILAAARTLYSPLAGDILGSCRAFFRLGEGLTAGEPLRIVLNFNEGSQDVELVTDEDQQTVKFIQDGKMYIRRDNKLFNVLGLHVR